MMKKELKEKWLNALRSGIFKKGNHHLKDSTGGYCCLGVLGSICGLDDETLQKVKAPNGIPGLFLPQVLADDLGLSYQDQCDLSRINDRSVSFEPVIAAIERLETEVK